MQSGDPSPAGTAPPTVASFDPWGGASPARRGRHATCSAVRPMQLSSFLPPLAGGVLIGLAASLLLALSGRVAGISGIFGGSFAAAPGDRAWRVVFVAALVGVGVVASLVAPAAFSTEGAVRTPLVVVLAGVLVGVGTRLGSGCTSGHGVCGLSRGSPRSLVATMTFIAAGMAVVAALRGVVS